MRQKNKRKLRKQRRTVAKRKRRNNGRNRITRRNAPAAIGNVIRTEGVLRQIRLQHREFVKDINFAGLTNELEILEINPGLVSAFPWLAGVAIEFESYVYHGLKFLWIPAVGTGTEGSVALSPDYDAADDNSSISKPRLLSFQDSVRGPVWETFTCTCTRSNLQKSKSYYTRKGPLAADLDVKTYDALQLIISKTTPEGTAASGELWVEYDITLLTPQLNNEPEQTVEVLGRCGAFNVFTTASSIKGDVANIAIPDGKTVDWNELDIYKPGLYAVNLIHDQLGVYNALMNLPAGDIIKALTGGPLAEDGVHRLLDSTFITGGDVWSNPLSNYSAGGYWYCPEHELEHLDTGEKGVYGLGLELSAAAGGTYNDFAIVLTRMDESMYLSALKEMYKLKINNLPKTGPVRDRIMALIKPAPSKKSRSEVKKLKVGNTEGEKAPTVSELRDRRAEALRELDRISDLLP